MINEIKVEISGLSKVYGPAPEAVLPLVKQGVSKKMLLEKHGHILALNNINLSIPSHSILVVMGLSGSGKSTLVRHINRLVEPTVGKIFVDNTNVLEMSKKEILYFRRHNASMVFQNFALLPHRTVLQNVMYGRIIQGNYDDNIEKTSLEWIERVGLIGYEKHFPPQLSGGMQQRVGLARALSTGADLLLMDEAFSALDPLIRADMQNILLDLQAEFKKTIIFITHDLNEALRIGDRVAILNDGTMIQEGKPDDIIMQPANDYIANFTAELERGRFIKVSSIMESSVITCSLQLSKSMTVNEALGKFVMHDGDVANVTDDSDRVVGHVKLKKLIAAIHPIKELR